MCYAVDNFKQISSYPVEQYTDYPVVQLGDHYKSLLIAQALGDGKSWMLMTPFTVEIVRYGRITVPAGFVFDFASIPIFARAVYQPATGKHRTASVIHDWLYYSGMYSREEADEIFAILMELDGVMKVNVKIMHTAVRAGGWLYWNKRHK